MTPDPETLAMVLEDEGSVPWMYLDTADPPVVTCGAGHALCSPAAAVLLPWDQPREVVLADYAKVQAAPGGKLASFYALLTNSRLPASAVSTLASADLASVLGVMLRYYPGYPTFPLPARIALGNMAFNLGGGFPPRWHQLTQAVTEEDWRACAGLCHRIRASAARNARTAALFAQAAG